MPACGPSDRPTAVREQVGGKPSRDRLVTRQRSPSQRSRRRHRVGGTTTAASRGASATHRRLPRPQPERGQGRTPRTRRVPQSTRDEQATEVVGRRVLGGASSIEAAQPREPLRRCRGVGSLDCPGKTENFETGPLKHEFLRRRGSSLWITQRSSRTAGHAARGMSMISTVMPRGAFSARSHGWPACNLRP